MTTARRFVTRRVLIVDEKGQQMRGRVLLPMRPEVPKYHPLAESIGAFADDEGWEEFIVALDLYREQQNNAEATN